MALLECLLNYGLHACRVICHTPEKLTAAGKKEPAKGLEAKTSEAEERKKQKWEYTVKTSPAIKQK